MKRLFGALLIGGAAFLYGASPVDVVPEVLLGPVGLVDDAAVVAAAIAVIVKLLTGKNKPQSPAP